MQYYSVNSLSWRLGEAFEFFFMLTHVSLMYENYMPSPSTGLCTLNNRIVTSVATVFSGPNGRINNTEKKGWAVCSDSTFRIVLLFRLVLFCI